MASRLQSVREAALNGVTAAVAIFQTLPILWAAGNAYQAGRTTAALTVVGVQWFMIAAAVMRRHYWLRARLFLYSYPLGLYIAVPAVGLTSGVGAIILVACVFATLLVEPVEAMVVSALVVSSVVVWRILLGAGLIERPPLEFSDVGSLDLTRRLLVALIGLVPIAMFSTMFLLRRLRAAGLESETLVDDLRAKMVALEREQEIRRITEQKLWAAQRLEALGQLAGGFAHDVNNNLTVALANAELLETGDGDPHEDRELAKAIREACESAAGLTRQFLALGRTDVNQPEQVAVATVVERVERLMRSTLPRNVKLAVALPEAPLRVHVDAAQMQQVLINLIINARDAMPDGGTITVAVSRNRESSRYDATSGARVPGDHVRLSVRDEGAGVAEGALQRIFEPFFTTKAAGRGTGLGLALAQSFAEASGGCIGVTTRAGEGATFTLELPAVQAERAPTITPSRDLTGQRRPTILVAEDDDRVRAIIVGALREVGYRVAEAKDGASALEIATHEVIDLLCADVAMPNTNGEELIATFRERQPRAGVIVCSAHVPSTALRDSMRAGELAVLRKPFSPRQLRDAVRNELGPSAS